MLYFCLELYSSLPMKDDEVKTSVQMWTLPCEHYTLTLFLDFPWFKHTSIPSVKFAEQKKS